MKKTRKAMASLLTRSRLRAELEATYEELKTHTYPVCRDLCDEPHGCCDDVFCEVAQAYAKGDFGIDLDPADPFSGRPRFLTVDGCVVPPYLRPACTTYTCKAKLGPTSLNGSVNPAWDRRFVELASRGTRLADALRIPDIPACQEVMQRRGKEIAACSGMRHRQMKNVEGKGWLKRA